MIVFACFSPHAPIFLPNVGSPANRLKVKKTIDSLNELGKELTKINPDKIIISSPHPDWGINVPLHFLAGNLLPTVERKPYLTDFESPQVHFEKGKLIANNFRKDEKIAWIASGDMSHRLTPEGPYGFNPAGPKFDEEFIRLLKAKDIPGILDFDKKIEANAAECGMRSFCMLLGALEELKINWQPKVLSYEGPFGVGYLVARLV